MFSEPNLQQFECLYTFIVSENHAMTKKTIQIFLTTNVYRGMQGVTINKDSTIIFCSNISLFQHIIDNWYDRITSIRCASIENSINFFLFFIYFCINVNRTDECADVIDAGSSWTTWSWSTWSHRVSWSARPSRYITKVHLGSTVPCIVKSAYAI